MARQFVNHKDEHSGKATHRRRACKDTHIGEMNLPNRPDLLPTNPRYIFEEHTLPGEILDIAYAAQDGEHENRSPRRDLHGFPSESKKPFTALRHLNRDEEHQKHYTSKSAIREIEEEESHHHENDRYLTEQLHGFHEREHDSLGMRPCYGHDITSVKTAMIKRLIRHSHGFAIDQNECRSLDPDARPLAYVRALSDENVTCDLKARHDSYVDQTGSELCLISTVDGDRTSEDPFGQECG